MSERFEDSPEYEDWIQETGGRDEDHSDYYNKWMRRKQRESLSQLIKQSFHIAHEISRQGYPPCGQLF